MMDSSNVPSPDPNPPKMGDELAKDRTRLAAERTLMAWIRTALSMIGFGFGVDSLVSAILSFQVVDLVNPIRLSRLISLSFIALGIYALLAAVTDHAHALRHIRTSTQYTYAPRRSIGMTVSVGLLVIGVAAFVNIAIQSIIHG